MGALRIPTGQFQFLFTFIYCIYCTYTTATVDNTSFSKLFPTDCRYCTDMDCRNKNICRPDDLERFFTQTRLFQERQTAFRHTIWLQSHNGSRGIVLRKPLASLFATHLHGNIARWHCHGPVDTEYLFRQVSAIHYA